MNHAMTLADTPLRAGRAEPTMPEGKGHALRGGGSTVIAVRRQKLWDLIMDESRLAAAIPGAETLHRVEGAEDRTYAADVGIGVGPIKGVWKVHARFAEVIEPAHIVLFGGADGPLGKSFGEGWIDFEPVDGGTRITYSYAILISGMVAKVGGKLIDGAADKLIEKFYARLEKAIRSERRAAV
ncbi:molybdopterin binding aldehyde oxidase and xanthine dehydrogenase [Stappia sp. 22II-S9-Z10]|nr:molybdopterin binding aldehyde oxidase and xanthine dehydrogenase [Stappia sp. 22II-S9-Z10]